MSFRNSRYRFGRGKTPRGKVDDKSRCPYPWFVKEVGSLKCPSTSASTMWFIQNLEWIPGQFNHLDSIRVDVTGSSSKSGFQVRGFLFATEIQISSMELLVEKSTLPSHFTQQSSFNVVDFDSRYACRGLRWLRFSVSKDNVVTRGITAVIGSSDFNHSGDKKKSLYYYFVLGVHGTSSSNIATFDIGVSYHSDVPSSK